MDFVERLFGISPDAGSGAFEACLIVAAVVAICTVLFRHVLRRAWARLLDQVVQYRTRLK